MPDEEVRKIDVPTKNLSRYVKEKGINISKMSRDTGISYMALYDSLMNTDRERDLRAGEMLQICKFLGVNPLDFDKPIKEKVTG